MNISQTENNWKKADSNVFWGEIAPNDHLVQIYENDEILLDSLLGFVSSGFDTGDGVVIIATQSHLEALNAMLVEFGFNLDELRASGQYQSMNAEEGLKKFMVNGWPDEARFVDFVKEIIVKARGDNNRRVRAFGEMVAILWAQGYSGATVQLEHLWNRFCETEAFCLFCSYPKAGFTQDIKASINHICSTHTRVIDGDARYGNDILYKNPG